MAKNRELELKLEIAAKDAERLRQLPLLVFAPTLRQRQDSIYFDTPKRQLRRAGFTLRVRRTDGAHFQTVKAQRGGAGRFDRDEWETRVDGMKPDLEAARKTPLADFFPAEGEGKLKPIAQMAIDRTSWVLGENDSTIEVTLDEGTVSAGNTSQAINELELELKHGSESALFALCDEISSHVPLRLGVLSKADLALAAADGKLTQAVKAPRVELVPGMTVAEGFTTIVLSCLQHFRLNEDLVIKRRDPDALHQLHVASRRLRAAYQLFRPILRQSHRGRRLFNEVRGFSRKLGTARNLDISIAMHEDNAPELAELQPQREKAYDLIVKTLQSRHFLGFMLSIVRWLFVGKWRQRPNARLPLASFVNWRIDKSWTRLSEAGTRLRAMGEKRRHQFRIKIKEFRYALEFVRDLHRHDKEMRKRFRNAVESLQEHLGLLNDRTIARQLALRTGIIVPGIDDADIDEVILAKSEQDFAELLAVGPYWRGAT